MKNERAYNKDDLTQEDDLIFKIRQASADDLTLKTRQASADDLAIEIRQASENDLEALYELIQAAMHVYARQSGITQPLDALCETKEILLQHIDADYVLVAVRHGELIGTVRLVRHGVSTAYFSRFAVLPHLRQTGVGKQLYEKAENWLREQNFSYVVLHTALSNETLVAFYQARGFHLIHSTFDRGYARGTFAKELRSVRQTTSMQILD